MPGLFSWKSTKPKSTSKIEPPKTSTKAEASRYTYFPIGRGQIRLLRYVLGSEPDKIRLEIQVFDRRTKPQYSALSYVCGAQTPKQMINLNGCSFEIGPNLYNALRCARKGLLHFQWFWIDAICIDQKNTAERNDQVRAMAETYSNATAVASWIGLCDERLKSAFTLDVQTTRMVDLSRSDCKTLCTSIEHLSEMQYWKRIWIQQELLLNPNITLFCGQYAQPLHPLIDWTMSQYVNSDIPLFHVFSDLRKAVGWFRWQKAPVLRLLTWAGHANHQSTDPRDKMYALLSQVVERERAALRPYFPDYGLTLSQLLMVTMAHVRRFSGQRRASLQLDSIFFCFGDPGDSACADIVRKYYWALKEAPVGPDGQRSMRLPPRERMKLKSETLLNGELNALDVCDCIFAKELGSGAGLQIDVRSSRTWRRSEVWGFDPPLSDELNHYWLVSYSREMEDFGRNNRR